ncbi:hypothetical protein CK203_074903 [Vitis vinifera]|uniref:Uncharacterized protein n=1 Tax=Vitis vinifera TaxID=29760 RepID=A0A438DE64_VITVI|nr:hypothetical protein CK203_074903 [Vitis vinifera]
MSRIKWRRCRGRCHKHSEATIKASHFEVSKVMEDFVGEQQKINSHLNEKIDNLESSINVRMEGVYNDLSLRIEKVQDSIEKLTNLDIARGKGSFLLNPTITFKEPMQKDQGKVTEPFKASTSPGKRRETNSLGPNGKDANFVWDPGGIQHEVGVYDACKNRNGGETEETGEPKCISKALSGISHHEHTQCEFFAQ